MVTQGIIAIKIYFPLISYYLILGNYRDKFSSLNNMKRT